MQQPPSAGKSLARYQRLIYHDVIKVGMQVIYGKLRELTLLNVKFHLVEKAALPGGSTNVYLKTYEVRSEGYKYNVHTYDYEIKAYRVVSLSRVPEG